MLKIKQDIFFISFSCKVHGPKFIFNFLYLKSRHLEYLYRNLEYNKCGNENRVSHSLLKNLIHLFPIHPFSTSRKHHKTVMIFPRGGERVHCSKWVNMHASLLKIKKKSFKEYFSCIKLNEIPFERY